MSAQPSPTASSRIIWPSVVTVISAAILIGAEVFGAAFAGGWALAILFGLDDTGAHILQAVLFAIGVFVALFVLAALGLRPESGVPADRRAWRRGGTRRHPAHNPTAHPMPRGLFLPRRLIGDMFARREVAGHRMARASRNARFREICDAGCVCCLALPIEYVSEELPLRLSLSSLQ